MFKNIIGLSGMVAKMSYIVNFKGCIDYDPYTGGTFVVYAFGRHDG